MLPCFSLIPVFLWLWLLPGPEAVQGGWRMEAGGGCGSVLVQQDGVERGGAMLPHQRYFCKCQACLWGRALQREAQSPSSQTWVGMRGFCNLLPCYPHLYPCGKMPRFFSATRPIVFLSAPCCSQDTPQRPLPWQYKLMRQDWVLFEV